MARFFAWGAAAFLMLTGAFLLWQGRAQDAGLPPAPKPRMATPFTVVPPTLPEAPASTPRTREQKRFGRADKDDDGRITAGRTVRSQAQGVRQARHQCQWRIELRRMGGEDGRPNSPPPTRIGRVG